MGHQKKSYKKFVATAATATLVASAIVPVASASFTDVGENNEFAKNINAAVEAGYVKGYEDGTFGVNDNLKRSQVVIIIGRYLEKLGYTSEATTSPWSDVTDAEVIKYGNIVKDAGVFTGYADGTLNGAGFITRENMAVVLDRLAKTVTGTSLSDVAGDIEDIKVADLATANADYQGSIQALRDLGISTADNFNPKGNVKRGQFAKFIVTAVEKIDAIAPTAESIAKEIAAVDATLPAVADIKAENAEAAKAAVEAAKKSIEAIKAKIEKAELTTEEKAELNKAITAVEAKYAAIVEVADKALAAVNPLVVESVSAVNASQVKVVFSKEVNKDDAQLVDKYLIGANKPTKAVLESDKKTVTLTFASQAAVEVIDAVLVVNPVKTEADASVTSAKYTKVFTYKDEVKPTIISVESKTNGNVATSVTVKVSEPVVSSLAKVNGTYYQINFNGTDTATITGLSLEKGKQHTLELINLTDKAGTANVTVSATQAFNVVEDKVVPTVKLSQKNDKTILATFDKSMNVEETKKALANGVVKDETYAPVATGAVTVVPNTDNKQFLIPVTATLFTNKDSRTLTLLLNDTLVDSLGNKLVPNTQTVTLTKDTAKPVVTSYTIVRESNGKVKAIEVNFNEELKASGAADSIVAGQTLHQATTSIVNENGVAETAKFAKFISKPVADGDKKVVFEAAVAEKIEGKFVFSFINELVEDISEVGNKSAVFNHTIDFGQGQSVTEFELPAKGQLNAPTATANVITVTFPEAVKGGGVANSATDISNYTLAGKPLAEGTVITLDPTQTIATITLPAESVSKDDQAAIFTVANIKNTAGTKTVKPYTGTLDVKDNIAPVLQSAKILDNKTIELTYNEAIQIDASATNTNLGDSFVIKQGDTVLSLADAELTGTVASGFDTKLVLKIAKGTDKAGTPALAAGKGNNGAKVKVAISNTELANKKGTGRFVIRDGKVYDNAAPNSPVVTLTGSTGSYTGSFDYNGVKVTLTNGANNDNFEVSVVPAVPGTSATVLDLTKDITIETKAAATKKVVDKSAAKNEQKATVKVNVVKP